MKIILVWSLIFALILSGCSDVNIYTAHSEPEELVVIKTIGIDRDGENITVTATTGTTANEKIPEIYTSTASTLAEAVNGIQNGYQGKVTYFAHAEQILLGNNVAENGITEILDYVGRNPNMRLSARLFVVKDGTAQSIIEDTNETDIAIADMLDAIEKRSEYMASGRVFTCKDVMGKFAESGKALIYTIKKEEPVKIENDENSSITPGGYALFENGSLIEYLDSGVTEGIGIILGHTKSGMLTVDVQNHGIVTLKVIDIKSKFEAEYDIDAINKIKLKLCVELNIEESAENLNFISKNLREKIETAAGEEIYETVIIAINQSQKLGVDFCEIGEKLNIKNPYKFRRVGNEWEETFRNIKIELEVKTELKRTYDMENSLNYRGV